MSTGHTGIVPDGDLILIVYVHGFKGTDVTFEQFPERLQHLVQETTPNVRVRTAVFPVFETKGELGAATERFVDWLTTLTVEEEVHSGKGGGAGKAKVVLCGHSMGGLLIADAVISIKAHATDPGAPIWPRVIAVIAFDTPYLGLNPGVFKNSISKYAEHVDTAKQVIGGISGLGGLSALNWLGGKKEEPVASSSGTSGSGRSSPASNTRSSDRKGKSVALDDKNDTTPPAPTSTGWFSARNIMAAATASAALAAAGTAYYRRGDIAMGWTWVSDHAVWLKNLWDGDGMKRRLDGVIALGAVEASDLEAEKAERRRRGDRVLFRNFYTEIPPSPPKFLLRRSFCILPASHHPLYPYWRAVASASPDEVSSHIGMFNAKTNDAFYPMGLEAAKCITLAVDGARDWDGGGEGLKGWREEMGENREIMLVEEGL